MSKSHIINLSITNNTGYDLTYQTDWFDSGRVADNNSWPQTIQEGTTAVIQCYEKDWSLAGCSGYVVYQANGQNIAFAFSNPSVGTNKLGVGSDGQTTWNNMDNHDYGFFLNSVGTVFTGLCACTSGDANNAAVNLMPYFSFPTPPSGKTHIINLTVFNNSGYDLSYQNAWFDSGRLGDGQSWPQTIAAGRVATVQCYEKDMAITGCSGYVTYQANGQNVAIAFSNPLVGVNKLGVGSDGETTWDNMDNHSYQPFEQNLGTNFMAYCVCTSKNINYAMVNLELDLKSWMSNVGDSTPLNQMSIPGTHDSCATLMLPYVRCQYYPINTQMDMGIRFLDVRCKVSGNSLNTYHGIVPLNLSFDTVMQQIAAFLQVNPTETIVMSLKNEDNNDDGFSNIAYNNYIKASAYQNLFYLSNSIPTLGQVRGKIVFLRRYSTSNAMQQVGIDASGWQDNRTFYINNGNVNLAVEDLYSCDSTDQKINAVKSFLQTQSSYASSLMITFTSGYVSAGGPENFANIINPSVNQLLTTMPKQRWGIVPMDFPIYELNGLHNYTIGNVPRIIKLNF